MALPGSGDRPNWGQQGNDEKTTHTDTQKSWLSGELRSLLETSQNSRSSLCLLHPPEQGGRVMAYIWFRGQVWLISVGAVSVGEQSSGCQCPVGGWRCGEHFLLILSASTCGPERKLSHFPVSLRQGRGEKLCWVWGPGPWHGCTHVNSSTNSLRTSLTRGFLHSSHPRVHAQSLGFAPRYFINWVCGQS